MRWLEAFSRLIGLGQAVLLGSKGDDALPPMSPMSTTVDVDFKARLINEVSASRA